MEKSIDTVRAMNMKLLNGVSDNLAVDGSVTPVTFEAKPPAGKKWRMCRALVYLESNVNFSAELFANLTALTNGVQCKINNDVITTWKTNRDLALEMQDIDAPKALAKDTKSLNGVWDFHKAFGNSILIDETNGGVQVTINDDLSSLDAFYITIQGQVV